jgi:tRNA pseudouridine55 synthase
VARKRRGRPVHGWIVLDKPLGMTSTRAVGLVRRLCDAQKAGHGGTLDPLASGVLPIALGEATKTVPFVMDGAKRYAFTVRWGVATETDDAEGGVVETSPLRPYEAEIAAALAAFTGTIEQTPPAFSAIKIDGKRAYDIARAGADLPAMKARPVRIDALRLTGRPDADHADFLVDCGKGTYVRSLARDIARSLGTVGHVTALRRLRTGPFTLDHAVPAGALPVGDKSLVPGTALGHSPSADAAGGDSGGTVLLAYMLPIETALDDIPALALTEEEARSLRLGQAVAVLPVARRNSLQDMPKGTVVCAMAAGKLVAMARIQGGEIRPVRVLNV